jgi:hypothetical protein
METRAEHCKKESARYAAREKREQDKIERTESMVLFLAVVFIYCLLKIHTLFVPCTRNIKAIFFVSIFRAHLNHARPIENGEHSAIYFALGGLSATWQM